MNLSSLLSRSSAQPPHRLQSLPVAQCIIEINAWDPRLPPPSSMQSISALEGLFRDQGLPVVPSATPDPLGPLEARPLAPMVYTMQDASQKVMCQGSATPSQAAKAKHFHFSREIKRQYVLFRLAAESNDDPISVHADSLQFLQNCCPEMNIPANFRGYQRWFRDKHLYVTEEDIQHFPRSQWSEANAARGKRRKVSAPSPVLMPPVLSAADPAAELQPRNLHGDFSSLPPVGTTSAASEGGAPASSQPGPTPLVAPAPVDSSVIQSFLTTAGTDSYFRRVSAGNPKADEITMADLGKVFSACKSLGMDSFTYVARGGFGWVMGATMNGTNVVAKFNSQFPKTPAEDPLYREAHASAVLLEPAKAIFPARGPGMGLFGICVRPGRVVSMLVMEKVHGDCHDLLTRLQADHGPLALPQAPSDTARRFLKAFFSALAILHEGGNVAHCDLKSGNLLLRKLAAAGAPGARRADRDTLFTDTDGSVFQLLFGDMGGSRVEGIKYGAVKAPAAPVQTRGMKVAASVPSQEQGAGRNKGAAKVSFAVTDSDERGAKRSASGTMPAPAAAGALAVGAVRSIPSDEVATALLGGMVPVLCRGTPGYRDGVTLGSPNDKAPVRDAQAADVFAAACVAVQILNRHDRPGLPKVTPNNRAMTEDPRKLFETLVEDGYNVSDAEWERVAKDPRWMRALTFLLTALDADLSKRATATDPLQHPFLSTCPQ